MSSPVEIQLLRWPSQYTYDTFVSLLNYHWLEPNYEEENKNHVITPWAGRVSFISDLKTPQKH